MLPKLMRPVYVAKRQDCGVETELRTRYQMAIQPLSGYNRFSEVCSFQQGGSEGNRGLQQASIQHKERHSG